MVSTSHAAGAAMFFYMDDARIHISRRVERTCSVRSFVFLDMNWINRRRYVHLSGR